MTKQSLNNKPKTKIALSVVAALSIAAIALPASAGKYRNSYDNSSYDYARVVSVDPLLETYQVNEPVEHCWNERVAYRDDHYDRNRSRDYSPRSKSRTPEVLGAIIGGVIGNQVGKRGGGKARDVATVAGAVLGGSIGRDVKNQRKYRERNGYDRHSSHYDDRYNNQRHTTRYETVQQCELKDSYVTKEKVVGYDVGYKYKGKVFYSKFDQHPGDRVKVEVTVRPV